MGNRDLDRLQLLDRTTGTRREELAQAVRTGLTSTPKYIPCCFFYDDAGSALFDQICELPEYYLTRAEDEILRRHAGAIVASVPSDSVIVELGSGSCRKTRILIAAALARTTHLRYVPLDICRVALTDSAHALLAEFAGLSIQAVAAEYDAGLPIVARLTGARKLVLWLGSNVGNLHRADAAAFLARVRATMGRGDRLVLGADLRKERSVLEAAYDDAAGVTARFNLNLLARINRELDADFDLDAFAHRATWLADAGRIEMHLVSRRAQRVRLRALDIAVDFAVGEAVHTENSYKYSPAELDALACAAGMVTDARWSDGAGRFSVSLLRPSDGDHPE